MKSAARVALDAAFQLLILGIFADAVWGVPQDYTRDNSSAVHATVEAVLVMLMVGGGVLGARRPLRDAGVERPKFGRPDVSGPMDRLEWMRRHRGLGPVLNVLQLLYPLMLLAVGVLLCPVWIPMFLGWAICGVLVTTVLSFRR
ncbi:hypothetical protein EDD99_2702 [Streptomyces sp. 846.5]|nr:hypothetical protein [Streptomyces sp. 846.5]TDU04246.1 hypothetical protein EDD99_2702 [Streptomyces sp. 846.5]